MKKKSWISLFVVIAVILIAYFVLNKSKPTTSEEVAKCIGENSVLYIQLGCSACRTQEEIFGDNYKNLNVIDCFYTPEKCQGITATPTWIIKGEKYVGVQSIDELKELTGCG